MRISSLAWALGVVLCGSSSSLVAADWKFAVQFPAEVSQTPFSGRVYLLFSHSDTQEPRFGPDWFHPEPFVAVDVENWQPGTVQTISAATPHLLAFPQPLADLDLTGHRVQAVIRFNPFEREVGVGPGNGYSPVLALPEQPGAVLELNVNQRVIEAEFPNNDWCQELQVPSPLLTQHYGQPVSVRAAVRLPASYHKAEQRRYPVIFTIPGFGGTHRDGIIQKPIGEQNAEGVEFIRVLLDPSCPLGHHVFADSANNGPWGTALIQEFIPVLNEKFRTVDAPTARFVTGHSSGGWSSLWLQVTYPDTFGGTWSTSPDPVDFHDFQRIDLYQPGANLFRDEQGQRRPIARRDGQVMLWYDSFCDMEHVLGPGGQIHSFEAVFSPRGEDGKPRPLYDRRTGAVDMSVSPAWEKYDIRLTLQENWAELGPKLAGKLHIFMGDADTFYLEGATLRLKQTLKELGSDAAVDILPGKDHFNLFGDGLFLTIREQMTTQFLKHHQP